MMRFNFLLAISIVLSLFTFNCSRTVETEKASANSIESKAIEVKNEQLNLPKIETAEDKAVRIAEEFIARNGYTDAPADKDNLSYENIEFYKDINELLAFRHNTLEPEAYGILSHGKMRDKKGWTVVFRYSQRHIKNKERKGIPAKVNLEDIGRAVTMNENFQNLLVEHVDFLLSNVEKIIEK